jgi:rubrerythrin
MAELELGTILAQAVGIEMDGLEVYLRFAMQTQVPTGKNMFIRLAKDELQHLRLFEEYRSKLLAGKEVAVASSNLKPIQLAGPELRKIDRVTKGRAQADELAALEAARDFERRSIEFYARWASKTADLELRKLLLTLKEVEESHFELIQAEIDSLSGTGFWFGIPEFNLEAEPS